MQALPPAVAEALAALEKRVHGDLRTDDYSRIFYSTDASIFQVEPYGVLLPRSTEDLHAAVEVAAAHGLPLLPRTSGSSLAGQTVNEALVLDMSRHLDQILELDVEARRVRVEPGIVLDDLNRRLRPHGLQFGPDPASSDRAAMGGIVANNSTGSHSILYGMTADHVVGMNVILSDGSRASFGPVGRESVVERGRTGGLEGEIYRRVAGLVSDEANREVVRAGTPRHWRRCGGYNLDRFVDGVSFLTRQDQRFNLARLVCGSEGTLALIEDITLNLVPTPECTGLALLQFRSLEEALLAVPVVLEGEPSAVELLDHMGITLCRGVPEYARLLEDFVEGDPNCLLITEFHGKSEVGLRGRIDRLAGILRRAGVRVTALVPVLDAHTQASVWKVRKVALGLLMSIQGDHKPIPFIEDAAVPVEHLSEYVRRIEEFCNGLGTKVAYYAHASAGCIHIRPLINAKVASEVAKMPEILSFSVELLQGYGGSLSSEHGDGRARSWINERFFGPDLYGLYRQVKGIFDRDNLFNPGNVVEGPAMTDNLRFGSDYAARQIETKLDFAPEGGFGRAIEMCNGAGVCRKESGTMCPSFMVTREEEHSTRGRANALRAALSGALPESELTGSRMHEVMDLCVECKGCKAECPSSVDMAKIKAEFLAQYQARHGVPLRSRLFGSIAGLSRLASGALAPMANAAFASAPGRAVLSRLGVSKRRSLPEFARHPFGDWFAGRERPAGVDAEDRVALFNDTFNTYNHPHVARAAVEVLEAAGCAVELGGHRCCGRPLISKGLIGPAREAARQTVRRLAPLAEAGVPIVGLEPSCILTLRDEYLYLLPGEPDVELVAERALTFEEFLAERAAAGRLGLTFTDESRQVLLHGHCHQKALVGTAPAHNALSLPPNYTVAEIDSGCCGMAGSFGYEEEHYYLSVKMAERRLWPAVAAADSETLIVAAGFSCRQQIEHGTDRVALHPAEVLRQALSP